MFFTNYLFIMFTIFSKNKMSKIKIQAVHKELQISYNETFVNDNSSQELQMNTLAGYDERFPLVNTEPSFNGVVFKKKQLLDYLSNQKYSIQSKIRVIEDYNNKYGITCGIENKICVVNVTAGGLLSDWDNIIQM